MECARGVRHGASRCRRPYARSQEGTVSRPPKDVERLRAQIIARHDELSPRLRQVAAYVLDHPNDMGLQTLAVIAERCEVQPSTIVRFAKAFGYDGASQMQ